MSLHDSFEAAVSYLSNSPSLSKVSAATKLELYGLFKYVTVSPTPNASRPSIFDMTGRAKWDAWNSAGKKYTRKEDGEQRYIEIAKSLGWVEGTSDSQIRRSDLEDIWDSDDDPTVDTGARSGGMGGAVSTMPPPAEEPDENIHSFAISNNISGMTRLLETCPDTDLNELDRFGYTPLHLACDRGNLTIVQILLSKGANSNIKDPDGLSASELAQIAGHNRIQEYLSSTPSRSTIWPL